MDCLQQEVSRCLGPVQCTEAHLHKAPGNIAATTAGLLLEGSATGLGQWLSSSLDTVGGCVKDCLLHCFWAQ